MMYEYDEHNDGLDRVAPTTFVISDAVSALMDIARDIADGTFESRPVEQQYHILISASMVANRLFSHCQSNFTDVEIDYLNRIADIVIAELTRIGTSI